MIPKIIFAAKTLCADNNKNERKDTPHLVTDDILSYHNGGIKHPNVDTIHNHVHDTNSTHHTMAVSVADVKEHSHKLNHHKKDCSSCPNHGKQHVCSERIVTDGPYKWIAGAKSIDQLAIQLHNHIPNALERSNLHKVKFVCANTSSGIYKRQMGYDPQYLVDVSEVEELKVIDMDDEELIIGGSCTISKLLKRLRSLETIHSKKSGINIIKHMADGCERVASTQLRNISSVAGNIMMARMLGFASDLACVLYGLKARLRLVILDCNNLLQPSCQSVVEMKIEDFLDHNNIIIKEGENKQIIIREIVIPFRKLTELDVVATKCYKVAKRLELSHAFINASIHLTKDVNRDIWESRIAFLFAMDTPATSLFSNGQSPFRQFNQTMQFIEMNQQLLTDREKSADFITDIENVFSKELDLILSTLPHHLHKPYYQKRVVISLFKKFLLEVCHGLRIPSFEWVTEKDFSDIFHERRITTMRGSQKFGTYHEMASQPRMKVEAPLQSRGAAEYVWTTTNLNRDCVYANLLLSTHPFAQFELDREKIESLGCQMMDSYDMIETSQNENGFQTYWSFSSNYTVRVPFPVGKTSGKIYRETCNEEETRTELPIYGSALLAKDYTMCAGVPIALIACNSEQELENVMVELNRNHNNYVTYHGNCKLLRETQVITEEPILSVEKSRELGTSLDYFPLPHKITTPNLDYSNPDIQFSEYSANSEKYITMEGQASTGSQIHFYLEPHATIATPTDKGGVHLFCATQSPGDIQQTICGILKLPTNQVVIEVARLGGAFGSKGMQSIYCATLAASASLMFNRQIRLALDRNTDASMMGMRHPFNASYKIAYEKETKKIKAFEIDYNTDAGYSQDCSQVVSAVALANSFNCYNFDRFYAHSTSWMTNRVSNTAMRTFGMIQASFLCESAIEKLCDEITISEHSNMLQSEQEFTTYEKDLYKNRVEIRKENFLKDGDCVPYGSVPLEYVNVKNVFESTEKTYYECVQKVIEFNSKNHYKKMGLSMIPLMSSITFNAMRFNIGEATVSAKQSDGMVTIIVGGVDMGQGLNTRMIQIAAQVLQVPMCVLDVAVINTYSPPNPSGTGASTATDLNGQAVRKACLDLRREIEQKIRGWWNKRKDNPDFLPEAFTYMGLDEGRKVFNELILLATTNNDQFCYPEFWVKGPEVERIGCLDQELFDAQEKESTKLLEEREILMRQCEGRLKFLKTVWQYTIMQSYLEQAQLLFSAHVNLGGEGINFLTGRGDPDYYQTYASAVAMVEVDILTGETNVHKVHLVYDAGMALSPASDLGQCEGGFIMGMGMMLSEEVEFDQKTGFNLTNGTWEYKPPFSKSIPLDMSIDLFTAFPKIEEWYKKRLEYVLEKKGQFGGGIMSSKSTGEPPMIVSTSVFFAVRDALRNYRDQQLFKRKQCSANHFEVHSFDFAAAPATIFKVFEAVQNLQE